MFHIGLGTDQQLVDIQNRQARQNAAVERANQRTRTQPSWMQRLFGRKNECETIPAPPALSRATTHTTRPRRVFRTNGTV